jgi:hypothetical protein
MNEKGIVIFAHNNKQVDYGILATVAAGLAKKNLKVPVTLITDKTTIEWMQESGTYLKAIPIFHKIILVENEEFNNHRLLFDGTDSQIVPFKNLNRNSVWNLTPYETTLLIDSDFLIFSDYLDKFWDLDFDVMISSAMQDIKGTRAGILDKRISETGVRMLWATTVMFKKNHRSKLFFDLVDYIKDNYKHYADLFRFNPKQYRNDISFSIAKHILDGFEENLVGSLPSVLTTIDKDILHSVLPDGSLLFLLNNEQSNQYSAISILNTDVHVMNKQSVVRVSSQLLELI